jgi:hypothetical protein
MGKTKNLHQSGKLVQVQTANRFYPKAVFMLKTAFLLTAYNADFPDGITPLVTRTTAMSINTGIAAAIVGQGNGIDTSTKGTASPGSNGGPIDKRYRDLLQ